MSLSLWIPPDWQFGVLAPGEARGSAMHQAAAQAINRHLFEQESEFSRVLRKFAQGLATGFVAPASRPATQSLWNALFPEQERSDSPPGGEAQPPVTEPIKGAFCLAVQALCSALAFQWLGSAGQAGDDEDVEENSEESVEANPWLGSAGQAGDDEDLGENQDGGVEEKPGEETPQHVGGWQADYQRVVRALVALLRQTTWRWLRDKSLAKTIGSEDWRFIATVCLNTLLESLDNWFVVETGETEATDGGPRTSKHIVLHDLNLVERLEHLVADLPFRFTLHPLKTPGAYRLDDCGPSDESDKTDYFRIDLIGYRRTNAFLHRFLARATHSDHYAPKFQQYIEAVNLQQAVPWRINRELLHWARCLVALGGGKIPVVGEAELSQVARLDPGLQDELREWVHKRVYRPSKTGTRKTIELPGEFLDSPLAHRVIEDLCHDGPDGPQAFYLPWKADYRGRLYAETPWLTPQGGDLQRALFEFHRGRPLDEEGARALRRHGANLVKRWRVLDDLDIKDRQVVTLDERERWVIEHEEPILASAASPLTEPFWRTVAGKPMQFLAFCLAYRQWKLDPSALVHTPVQIDGTCNGLQHIAVLAGDAKLARAVNVLPRDDHLPGDIYSELAAAAAANLGQLPCNKDDPYCQGIEFADAWLACSLHPSRKEWLSREVAKKVVMTIPYGASHGAQAWHVLKAIANNFKQEWQDDPNLYELVDWKEQDKDRQTFVRRCTRRLLGKPPEAVFSGGDDQSRLQARQEWERRRTLAAYVALALVRHLHRAISAAYPSVNAFSGWLKKTARACEGLPLLWYSPLGFPLCQDKFTLKGTSVTGRLGGQPVRIDIQRLSEVVSPMRQQSALLPNLIHSLDATHLAMTLLEASKGDITDIGSIHDCLLCHPNDAAALGQTVRNTFAQLYKTQENGVPNALAQWSHWMDKIAQLRGLSRAKLVVGALDHPNGMGENMLFAQSAEADRVVRQAITNIEKETGKAARQALAKVKEGADKSGKAARHDLAVINDVRSLPTYQQLVMRDLLEFMQDSKPRAGRAVNLPTRGNMVIKDGSAISEYFFS